MTCSATATDADGEPVREALLQSVAEDAEGRVVLADGVAFASGPIVRADDVIDMATLTGAQMVATGR